MSDFAKAMVERSLCDSFGLAVGRYAVYDAISIGIVPASALDCVVGGVVSNREAEDPYKFSFVEYDMEVSAFDVVLYDASRGIAVRPLVHVAVLPHESARLVVDLHYRGGFIFERFSNEHAFILEGVCLWCKS